MPEKCRMREAISLACPWPLWANTNSQTAGQKEEWIREPCTNCEQFPSVKGQWQLAVSSYLLPALEENKNKQFKGNQGLWHKKEISKYFTLKKIKGKSFFLI